MCDFFSLISDGAGNVKYFDYEIRKQIIEGTLRDSRGHKITSADSHSSIMSYFGIYGAEEDMYNKYEYNPLTKNFVIDTIKNKNDSEQVNLFCSDLDFKTIVPELQIKEIINPKKVLHGDIVAPIDIALLMQWASVGASVRDSVRASVWAYISSFYSF